MTKPELSDDELKSRLAQIRLINRQAKKEKLSELERLLRHNDVENGLGDFMVSVRRGQDTEKGYRRR